MAGWFDHERDFTAEPHAPIRTPDYDDLGARSLEQLRTLKQVRVLRLVLAISAFGSGALTASLPVGWALVIPATFLFVSGLIATPISAWLLRSVNREIRAHEVEAAYHRDHPEA